MPSTHEVTEVDAGRETDVFLLSGSNKRPRGEAVFQPRVIHDGDVPLPRLCRFLAFDAFGGQETIRRLYFESE